MSLPSLPPQDEAPLSPHAGEQIAWACAQTAYEAKRYNDSIHFYNELIKYEPRLSKTQRELLSSAYKHSINSARNSLHIIDEELPIYEKKGETDVVMKLKDIQKSLKEEITKRCDGFLHLIDNTLLPVASEAQTIVFYYKLKGDYYRYLAELSDDDLNSGRARASYEMAMKSVGDDMKMADPIYLGLILNFCVFQYEILGMKDEAIDRADVSFNEATRFLEELDEQEYSEATMILQLIRDNISMWREEKAEAESHP